MAISGPETCSTDLAFYRPHLKHECKSGRVTARGPQLYVPHTIEQGSGNVATKILMVNRQQ